VHDLVENGELNTRLGERVTDDHPIPVEQAVRPGRQRGAMQAQAQARAGDVARAALGDVVLAARLGDERADLLVEVMWGEPRVPRVHRLSPLYSSRASPSVVPPPPCPIPAVPGSRNALSRP